MPTKPRVLTPEEIEQVGKLGGLLTQDQLADYLGMATSTLEAIFKRQPEVAGAYKQARAKLIGGVAKSLVQDALNGDKTSQIFFLKTQAGWRETNRTEHTGAEGAPLAVTLIRRVVVDPKSGDGGS